MPYPSVAALRCLLAGVLAAFNPPFSPPALAQGEQPARLTGIVVGPQDRVAIFADPANGTPVPLHEGETIGPFLVERINPAEVTVAGPGGQQVLQPVRTGPPARLATPDPAPTPLSPLEGARNAGIAAGRLVTQRDECVRRGFLPPARTSATAQMEAMLRAMGSVPPRTGEDRDKDAPAQIAAATRAGWEAAIREDRGEAATTEACADVDRLWKRDAGRYGLSAR